jgi:membrane fusion protein (multidrug efflux system)
MHGTFPRSLRELSRRPSVWWPLSTGVLLAAWSTWMLLARVTVYAVSDAARLEVEQDVCPVEAGLDGRVTATYVVLDADVQAGDTLVVLDSVALQLERDELRAARASHAAELLPLADEVRAIERQLDDLQQAAAKGSEEQDAGLRETEAAQLLADSVVARAVQLGAGLVADAELKRAQSEADRLRAAGERQRAARGRTQWERRATASELTAALAASRHRLVEMEGECAVVDAKIARLGHEIERRTIRAPIAGKLGETADLRPGQAVGPNTRVAAIVPGGQVRIVATFLPAHALGRVRVGQTARLRLLGFPWTQYGFVSARVSRLASEALSGTVRVEAEVTGETPFPLALQHGWPGVLEIEVEHVAPATLAVRAAGAVIAPTANAAPAGREVR